MSKHSRLVGWSVSDYGTFSTNRPYQAMAGYIGVYSLGAGETINYNANKITHSQPVLWIDNLLDSLEISSEESF